jgi:hypothetical protein
MPYYSNDTRRILFIHIPKTGGTSLEEYLQKMFNGNQTLKTKKPINTLVPDTSLQNISLQHQTYNTIYKYRDLLNVDFDYEKLEIITIVRKPYDRLISDLFHYKLIKPETDSKNVYNILKKYVSENKYDNHNIPQYKFVTDESGILIQNITIFRNETLNTDLIQYGFTDFNITKNINKSRSKKPYISYLNKDSIQFINEYYKKDFELFGYPMIQEDDTKCETKSEGLIC